MRELSASAASEPVEELELVDAAAQVSAWCGEPLLYDGDDPAITLAPGTARRRALDAAREEMAAGLDAPSPAWRFRFSLMLGLERVLAADQPALLNGLTLRPHQVDALAGMLAALTAGEERERGRRRRGGRRRAQRRAERRRRERRRSSDRRAGGRCRGRRRRRGRRGRRGRGRRGRRPTTTSDEDDDENGVEAEAAAAGDEDSDDEAEVAAEPEIPDPGAVRRYRFKHPTASGKTVAAAGFVEACRTVGVLILTHRRLLVDQFMRDLKEQGYGPAADRRDREGQAHPAPAAGHGRDLRVVHQARAGHQPRRLRRGHLRRGAHGARRAHRRDDPALQPPDLHRHDGHRPAAAEARRRRVPGRGGRLPAGRRRAARRRRPAARAARQARREPAQRAGRRRRLRPARAGRGARPRGAQHGRRHALPRPLRPPRGHRLRGRRRSRRARRRGHARDRPARPLGQRPHAAARTGGDARGLRARRHQRARQRAAAGGGLERAPRDGLHAPRADGQPPRLPAAHRPRHAPAPPQGGRRRRRLRRSRGAALRSHGHAPQPARRRPLQAGLARHAQAAAPAAALAPPGPAGAARRRVADPRHRRSGPAPRRDRRALEDRQRRPAAARRAGVLGRDRRAPRRAHRPPAAGRDAREGRRDDAHPLLRDLRGRVQAPLAAPDRARRPGGAPPRHQHDRPHGAPDRGGADLGERPRAGRAGAAARRSPPARCPARNRSG